MWSGFAQEILDRRFYRFIISLLPLSKVDWVVFEIENPETNKFAFIDRYMIDFKSWNKTLNEIEKVDSKISWSDKKEKIFWRGSASSDNQTVYGPD
jgi:hypothetical protein